MAKKLNFRIEESKEPKIFVYKSNASKLSPEKIPNLISEKNLEIIQKGDDTPYYKTQEIDITEKANGVLFTKEFWKSYLSTMEDHPIPGSRDGHHITWARRPPTDLFLIGGKLIKDTVYLKNYIPKEGDNGSNETFIKEAKSGMIHFSIVSYTKDKIFLDADGYITEIHAIESVKGERNDAVEVGLGAMAQKTNINQEDISDGKIKTEVKTMPGTEIIELKDITKQLKNLKANGEIDINKFAEGLGVKVVSDVHLNAVKTVDKLKKILKSEEVIEPIEKLIKEGDDVRDEAFTLMRTRKIEKAFGPLEIDKEENLKRSAAEKLITKELVEDVEIDKQIEDAKKDNVVMHFSKLQADYSSEENEISGKELKLKNDKKPEYADECVTL